MRNREVQKPERRSRAVGSREVMQKRRKEPFMSFDNLCGVHTHNAKHKPIGSKQTCQRDGGIGLGGGWSNCNCTYREIVAVAVSVFEQKTGVEDDSQTARYGRGRYGVFGETVDCEERGGAGGEAEYGGVDPGMTSELH